MLYVLYSTQTCKQNWNRACYTQGHDTHAISLESCARSQGDVAFERMLDPFEGSPATGKSVAGILKLFVDAIFGQMARMMYFSKDKEFVGWKIFNHDQALKSVQKGGWRIGGDPSRKEHKRRSPRYSNNAYKVQKPSGTDKLVRTQDTVSVLLLVFKMCFKGSFSNNWWCESF